MNDEATNPSNEHDARVIDALVEAGFDPDRVPEPLRTDARRVAGVLGLLDCDQALGGRQFRVERAVTAATPAFQPSEALDELSDAALESYVMSGYRADRVPSSLSGRARRIESIGAALSTPSRRTESWIASSREDRISATMEAVEQRAGSSLAFEPPRIERGSFRLADVIAAASILLLVSAVFVPALSAYRDGQHRAACLGGMSQAASAFGMYAGDYRESLPMATAGFGGSWMDVGTTPDRSNSANLFTLVRTGHAGMDDLACPGNEAAPTRVMTPDAVDWHSLEEVSYSYRIMVPRVARVTVLPNTAVVMADRSPVILRAARREPVVPEASTPNHRREGQHVLRLDGSVGWAESAVIDGDNIWLPREIERMIHTVRSRVGLVRGNELPESLDDAFLAP